MPGKKLPTIPTVIGLILGIMLYHGVKASLAGSSAQRVIQGDPLVVWEETPGVRIAQSIDDRNPPAAAEIEAELQQRRAEIEQQVEQIREQGRQVQAEKPEQPVRRSPPSLGIGRFQLEVEVIQREGGTPASIHAFKMDTSTGKTWVSKSNRAGEMSPWKEMVD